jgi:hypothetical protein
MTDRSKRMLAELNPRAQPIFDEFILRLDKVLGDNRYIVYEGLRRMLVQEAYFAQGRQSLSAVNALRKQVGLYQLVSDAQNYIITWTMKSKHIEGLAMDITPMNGAGDATWDLGHYWDTFVKIRDIGKSVGLVCGADWQPPDWPHYEIQG